MRQGVIGVSEWSYERQTIGGWLRRAYIGRRASLEARRRRNRNALILLAVFALVALAGIAVVIR